MKIKEINDIYKINIICTNTDEVMECKDILEKLGLKTGRVDSRKDRIIVRRVYGDSNFFTNCDVVYTGFDNISFYDFKKQTKNLIPVVQDIEYNKEDGRIIEINKITKKPIYTIENKCIEAGLYFISEEARDKALNKMIIETKLKNIASRLNKGKLDWNDFSNCKYSIRYNIGDKKLKSDCFCHSKNQGSICCLSDKFLEEAIKEIGENELINYFKE